MGLPNRDRSDSQHPGADQGARALDTLDRGALDRALSLLQERKARWARLPIADKIRYLEEVRGLVLRYAEAWVAAGVALKSLPPDSPLVGSEEWIAGPYPTVAWLTDVIRTLEAIRSGREAAARQMAGAAMKDTQMKRITVICAECRTVMGPL